MKPIGVRLSALTLLLALCGAAASGTLVINANTLIAGLTFGARRR